MSTVGPNSLDRIVGVSAYTSRIRAEVAMAADYFFNVLVWGPTGTGKELVAEAVHAISARRDRPFFIVDCASLPPNLFAGQLFGHSKGAFTGAYSERLGYFRAAEGGTIFLDEIGELDPSAQADLLRVLQNKTVTPLGSYETVPVDVRVVAATNRDLTCEVDEGRFRQDLYYRLNVISIETMALKQRPDDIEVLVEHFLQQLVIEHGLDRKWFSGEAMNFLTQHDWPGNVRELQNVVDRAAVASTGELIGLEALAPALQSQSPGTGSAASTIAVDPTPTLYGADATPKERVAAAERACAADEESNEPNWLKLAALERYHIEQTLRATNNNQSAAARYLGVTRRVLQGKLRQYELHASESKCGRSAASSG